MSFKEVMAIAELVGAIAIGVWLAFDIPAATAAGDATAAVAGRLLWAIGAVIVLNIVTTILVTIVASIAQGEEIKDEKDDERDRAINTRGMRNSGIVQSLAAAAALLLLAFGANPILAVYALLVCPLLGGTTDAVSRLVYYRIG